ncbi:hypothetical protein DL546_008380 [Coniochaeta pulveracea]|uniref:Uncharacterized protein n=1 Tax=Coniochaeta pulveracea TaxID=177199 RepID=A0A420YCK5_9PEZI|nr:hypothetical protein DL546_008380 [Coniochaeta pulveracea]
MSFMSISSAVEALKRTNYLRCPENDCCNKAFTAAMLKKHLHKKHRTHLGDGRMKDHPDYDLEKNQLEEKCQPTEDEFEEIKKVERRKLEQLEVDTRNIANKVAEGELNWVGTGPLKKYGDRVKKRTNLDRAITHLATGSTSPATSSTSPATNSNSPATNSISPTTSNTSPSPTRCLCQRGFVEVVPNSLHNVCRQCRHNGWVFKGEKRVSAQENVEGGVVPREIPAGAEVIDLTSEPENRQSSGAMPGAPSGMQVDQLPSCPDDNQSSGAMPAVPAGAQVIDLTSGTQPSGNIIREHIDFLLDEVLREVLPAAEPVVLTEADIEEVRQALRSCARARQTAVRV